MIVSSKEKQPNPSLLELLGGSGKSTKGKNGSKDDVFAQLLTSMGTQTKGVKKEEFAALIDPKKDLVASKNDDVKPINTKKLNAKGLEELLIGKEEEGKMFPKELIDALSNDQVRTLIHKAKEYLKNTISQSPQFKADPKELPKTLMGLVELADKIGVNMSEITLSTLDIEQSDPLKELSPTFLSKPLFELQKGAKEVEAPSAKNLEAITQLLSQIKSAETALGDEHNEKPLKEAQSSSAGSLQSLLKSMDKSSTPISEASKEAGKETIKEGAKEVPKTVASAAPTNIDALSALLHGHNEAENNPKEHDNENSKSLQESGKGHQTHKVDSLEVKAKEAVQSMRHFAIDLKEAAENYKPPFTRITMKLNPEKLGEVDVTLVQRGNNVHVNIQSNNASSVAFLAHNATELKAQLAHQGITNATMNFMAGGDSQQHNPNQQHNQSHNPFRAYQSFEELEQSKEELSALEIIIPHYA